MDLLSRVERALEGVVEGVFSRAFRTQLQPVEVAKRLTRELESHRAVSVHATYVPNVYTVHLAPDTYTSFQAISGRLLMELEQYLREFVAEHDYQTVGPLAVRLVQDAEVKANELTVVASNEAQAVPSAAPAPSLLRSYPAAQPTRRTPTPQDDLEHTTIFPAAAAAPTALEITAGQDAGRRLPLTDGLTIGRGPTNTLILTETGVSRQHAEITWADEQWVLHDLASTNGTYVNERRVTAHPLRVGDSIQVGQTTLRAK